MMSEAEFLMTELSVSSEENNNNSRSSSSSSKKNGNGGSGGEKRKKPSPSAPKKKKEVEVESIDSDPEEDYIAISSRRREASAGEGTMDDPDAVAFVDRFPPATEEDQVMDDLEQTEREALQKVKQKKNSTRAGKSAGRNYLKMFFGDAVFRKGVQPSPEDVAPEVIYEDTAQFFQSFRLQPPKGGSQDDISKAEKVKTPFNLIVNLKRSVEFNLSLHRYKVYVSHIDKGKFAPETKSQEQLKRLLNKAGSAKKKPAKKKKKVAEGEEEEAAAEEEETSESNPNDGLLYTDKVILDDNIPHTQRYPYVDPSLGFPRDWDDAMDDRNGTRRRIIGDIVFQWLDYYMQNPAHAKLREMGAPGGDMIVRVPYGKRWIIVGHCLTREYLNALDVPGVNQLSDDEIYATPLVVEGKAEGGQTMYLAYDLADYIGEADFGFFSLHEKLQTYGSAEERKPFASGLDIISTDTDIGYLGLMYLDKRRLFYNDIPQMAIKINSQFWIHSYKKPRPEYEEWMYINALYSLVTSYGEHSKLSNPVLAFLAAAFSGGGDYFDAYYGLPAYHWINALYHHGDHVGDFVKLRAQGGHLDVEVDGHGYLRLLKTTFMLARCQRFTSLKVGDLADQLCSANPAAPGNPPLVRKLIAPQDYTVEAVCEKTKTLGANNRFPQPEVIMSKAAQLLYYLKMVIQVGSPQLHFPPASEYAHQKVRLRLEIPSKINVPDAQRPVRNVDVEVYVRRHGAMEEYCKAPASTTR